MKKTILFPSRVWTFSMIVSFFIVLLLQSHFGLHLGDGFIKAIIHLILGYTFIFPFYFIFIGLGHIILKSKKSKFHKKLYFLLHGAGVTTIIHFASRIVLGDDDWFQFYCAPFYLSMVFAIWRYPMFYESKPSNEKILDDNFHIPKT